MNKYLAWYRTWGGLPVIDFIHGWDLAYRGKYALAAASFEKGLRNHPFHRASCDARIALAQCYRKLHQTNLFERSLLECIRLHRDDIKAHQILARELARSGAYRAASRILFAANRIKPLESNETDLLCWCLLKARAPRAVFHEGLQKLGIDIVNLGTVPRICFELRFGTLQRARTLLDQRFQAPDESADERLLYATFCLEQGKSLFARQLLRELYLNHKPSAEICYRLAQAFADAGQFTDLDAALNFALEAAKLSSYRHADALDLICVIYREKNEPLLTQLFEARFTEAHQASFFDKPANSETAEGTFDRQFKLDT